MTDSGPVRRSALFVAGQVLDRLCYAASLAIMTYFFGVSGETDVYFIVTLVPLLIAALNNETTLVAAMQFLSMNRKQDEHWAAVGSMLVFFVLLFFAMTVVVQLLAPTIVAVVGIGLDGASRARAVELERLAAWLVLANGIGSVLGAVLMREGLLVWAVFRSALSNALMIAVSVALLMAGATGIVVFLYGMLAGAVFTALLLLPPLLRAKGKNRIFTSACWRMTGGPFLLASSFYNALGNGNYQILVLVERTVASNFGPGFVTILSLARTMLTLLAFVPAGVANALFVDLAKQPWEMRKRDIARIGALIGRAGLFIALPALVIYFAGINAIVGILFERGKFDAATTGLVAEYAVLLGLAGPYMALSTPVAKVMQLAHLNRELALGSNFACAIYVAAAIIVPLYFGPKGLALCAALHGAVYLVTIYGILVRRFGWAVLSIQLPEQLAATAVSAAVVVSLQATSLWPQRYFLSLAATCVATFLPYAIMSYLLDLNRARAWLGAEVEKMRTARLLPRKD
jgi:putative peptidoglycan lipid II flippase